MEEEYEAAGGEVLLDNEDNDGWLATHGKPKGMLCRNINHFSSGLCSADHPNYRLINCAYF